MKWKVERAKECESDLINQSTFYFPIFSYISNLVNIIDVSCTQSMGKSSDGDSMLKFGGGGGEILDSINAHLSFVLSGWFLSAQSL